MPSSSNDKRALENLEELLLAFRNTLGDDATINYAAILVMIGLEGVTNQAALADHLGLAQSSISRALSLLGRWGVGKKPGLGLIVSEEDPEERRRRIVSLSPKGQRAMSDLLAAYRNLGEPPGRKGER
jgi:DNA-binding MarR family transcriptional regulator